MKRFLFLIILALMANAIQAKIVQGFKSTISEENNTEYEDYNRVYASYSMVFPSTYGISYDENLSGFKIGYLHGFNLIDETGFYLEFGGEVQYNWYSQKEYYCNYYIDYTMKFLTVNIPLNLAYKINLGEDCAFTPYTGFKMRINTLAEINDYSLFDDDYMNGESANRFQAIWQIGGGLSFKALYIGAQYGLDLSNFMTKTKTSEFTATLGINF